MASIGDGNVKARVILQQCLSARLMVEPAVSELPAKYVEINRGLLIYLCFLKGATEDILEKMVKSILNARLCEAEEGKLVSILDLPGDVLVIPQATLGGRLKGKMMQYHGNIEKGLGLQLYSDFVKMCTELIESSPVSKEASCSVKCGTYGNRQVLNVETNGPYSHMLEF